jgi:S-DNA-T family DNA segregation ATPase FtsK/SpoIIIE
VALSGVLAARLLLRCATADEAALWGLPDGAASVEVPAGRCWVGDHTAQVALPDPVPTSPAPARAGEAPGPVPTLPTQVRLGSDRATASDGWRVPVGLDGDTLAVVHLDLRHHHAVVAGPPRSGVTTALRTLVAHHPRAQLLDAGLDPDEVAARVHRALASVGDGRPRLVAIDDLAPLLDGPGGSQVADALAEVLDAGRRSSLRLVVGGEVESLGQCFHDVVAALRRGRTGLLLGGDPELHGAFWHAALGQRSDLPPAPGRGWLLAPGAAHRVQVALP